MSTQKPLVRLEGWAVVGGGNRAAYERLEVGKLLLGRVYGHQRIKSGMFIFTSPIVHIDSERNVVETKNTAYQLGAADATYRSWDQTHSFAA
jgi:hypothetical protein